MKKIVLYLLSFLLTAYGTENVFAGADKQIQKREIDSSNKNIKQADKSGAYKNINNEKGFENKLKKMKFPDSLSLPEIVIGNPNAPVTLIVYSSFTCSHCRDFHLNVFPKFKKKYVDTGKVKVYLRCFLDDLGALEAAILMRYFSDNNIKTVGSIYNNIYSRQKEWLKSDNPREFLKETFVKQGYPPKEIDKCLDNKNIENRKIVAGLMKVMQLALQLIHSVPAFVVIFLAASESVRRVHEGVITEQQLAEMCTPSD